MNFGVRRSPKDGMGVNSRSLYMCRPPPVQHVVPAHSCTQPARSNIVDIWAAAATRTSAHTQVRKTLATRTAYGRAWTSRPARPVHAGICAACDLHRSCAQKMGRMPSHLYVRDRSTDSRPAWPARPTRKAHNLTLMRSGPLVRLLLPSPFWTQKLYFSYFYKVSKFSNYPMCKIYQI